MGIKNFSVRIDDEMLSKLRVIAANDGRSVNSEILTIIQCAVDHWENEQFKIISGGVNVYTVSRTDSSGKFTENEYKTFCHAIGQLLFYVYNPNPGDYSILFTRKRDK